MSVRVSSLPSLLPATFSFSLQVLLERQGGAVALFVWCNPAGTGSVVGFQQEAAGILDVCSSAAAGPCRCTVMFLWKLDTVLRLQQFLLKGSLGKSQASGLFY